MFNYQDAIPGVLSTPTYYRLIYVSECACVVFV
jgi:hypothetical protein